MKLRSTRWLGGSVCLLLASAVAAACGSDSEHIASRAEGGGGAGGEGGQAVARGGEGTTPPQAGSGGEVSELGGEGGKLSGGAGAGGVSQAGQAPQGGGPATGGTPAGGAGGEGGAGGSPGDPNAIPCFPDPVGNAGAVSGAAAGALHFDGVNDTVLLYTGLTIANESAFTAELWFRSSTPDGCMIEIFSQGGAADRSLFLLGGKVCFYVYEPARSLVCTTEATYADGDWHHAAGSVGQCGQYLVVDGVLRASNPNTKKSAFNFEDSMRLGYGHLGADATFGYFGGDLDEVRIWNVARSPSEIALTRASLVDPALPELTGYWRLNDGGSSTSAADATAAKHDGTLQSFVAQPWITGNGF